MKPMIVLRAGCFKLRVFVRLIVSMLLLFLICCPQIAKADETGKSWSLEPFVDYGIVYEFADHITTYSGGGFSARWTPGPWTVSARWRSDEYEIDYYGVTDKTAQQLFMNTLTGPLLTPARIRERKEERELLFGRQVWGEHLSLFAGMRQVRLLNNYSSMNIFGPALKAEARYGWGNKTILMDLGGVLDRNGTVRNHRDDYILPGGETTISFYGQLRNMLDWSAMIESRPRAWGRLRFGYEGAVMSFKYGNRYFHGLTLKFVY